jgi:L-histidine N-alpha-methyltransferase
MKAATTTGSRAASEFAADVRTSLARRPRELPSRYLYDELGSALFEAICQLPWYAVTRAEQRLLAKEASRALPGDCRTLVELGPGSGMKMLSLLSRFQGDGRPLTIHLVDVSPAALAHAGRTLERIRGVRVVTHQAAYEEGFAAFSASRGPGPALAMFLGSNIGNFGPDEARAFVQRVRHGLRRGDGFLLGADLVKPEPRLLEAYDDPLGVTAAFNRNLLVRLQTELDARIDLGAFAHRAVWNAAERRVEMHLVSLRAQRIVIPAAGLDFEMTEGETIWTESSYKSEPADVRALLEACGFAVSAQWIDEADRFALTHALAE